MKAAPCNKAGEMSHQQEWRLGNEECENRVETKKKREPLVSERQTHACATEVTH